jgi:uncharacterized protein (DUF1919 family)|tara:strand:- start:320 stop:517 length:198 start_codon:yes stop_codon:yes gene_type:complete
MDRQGLARRNWERSARRENIQNSLYFAMERGDVEGEEEYIRAELTRFNNKSKQIPKAYTGDGAVE